MIYIIFIFLIGLCVGSFINVLESRLYRGEDIFKKPSHCDFCGKKLNWLDMIPVLSWVIYGGKSRCCRRQLSVQYPLVEFVTGVSFVLIFMLGFSRPTSPLASLGAWISSGFLRIQINNLTIYQISNLLFYFLIFTLSFSIFLQDLKYQAIHGGLLKALIIVTFFYLFFDLFVGEGLRPSLGTTPSVWSDRSSDLSLRLIINVGIAFLSALPFYLLYKLSKETWLGEGDVWIAFWMGLFLGFPRVLWAMYFGIIFGGVVSLIVLLLHLKKLRDTISLGPFLLIGTLISFFI